MNDDRQMKIDLGRIMAPEDRALMSELGRQVTVWAFGCDPEAIDNPDLVCSVMEKYSEANRLTVKDRCVSKFEPQGLTVALVLMESHILVNSWPERGVLQIEVFSCTELDVEGLKKIAEDTFSANRMYVYDMQ